MNIPSGFRPLQKEAGIWEENKDAFLSEIKPRQGQEKAYSSLMEMLEGNRRLLLISGESRAGKSWLLSGYINERLREVYAGINTRGVKYMTFFDMELRLRSAQTLGTMDKLFNELVGYQHLAIDELGRGKWSDFTATFFTNLLIRRYGEKRETLIATNLKADELWDMIDIALMERMKAEKAIVLMKKK